MGRKRRGGYLFIWWIADHPPRHVHVHDAQGRFLGRVRLDTFQPLDRWNPPTEVIRLIVEMIENGEL
jgi:hypothetical protein